VSDLQDFPRRFDSYILLKPLARGGMGDLHLALSGSPGMEKLCVIKKVLPHLVAPDNVQRFRDEAMVAVRLSHGNLVPVFDAGHSDDQIFIAMDFVDGKDLLATWNRCAQRGVPFPIEVAVYIVKELARGLSYAHAFGGLNLVHRDVSPANVLLAYSGEVKLTDFGLATSTLKLQHTAPGIIFGKLSYLAPEQARREPPDGRTDVYAAGILLWELLTGQQLFPVRSPALLPAGSKRDSTADALDRLRDPRVLPPSRITDRVPAELDRITMRALAPDPAQRYQNAEELRADLAAFLARTAPATDADRLAKFLKMLFESDSELERREREVLIRNASNWLSGEIPSGTSGARPPAAQIDHPADRAGDRRAGDPIGRAGASTGGKPAAGSAGASAAAPVYTHADGYDPRVGTTIDDRYILRRLCGEGAMGRVYEGQHIDIGRRVAVKILQSSYRHTPDVVERFRREARAASRVGHPNIVDVTDSGTTADGAFFFVMEYLDGINLEDLISRDGILSIERAILIGAQICRALQAAHAADVIHRDLKPANVMLINRKDEEDAVKVLDFGISKTLGLDPLGRKGKNLTNPDVAVGTPVYMSPEQAAGMAADGRTDIYAVGGLLYEMLTACPPCDGDNVLTILNKKASEDPRPIRELRADVPEDLAAVIMRALSRFPEDRQPSMAMLKDDLLRCLATLQKAPTQVAGDRQVAEMLKSGPTLKIRARIRSHAWLLGALATALVAGGGLWYFTHPVEPSPLAARAAARQASAGGSTSAGWPETPRPAPAAADSGPRIVELPSPARAAASSSSAPTGRPAPHHPTRSAESAPRLAATTAPMMAAALETPAPAAATGPALLARGQDAFNKENYPEAIRRARAALAAGAPLGAHLLLGDVYYHMERYGEALKEYQAALALEPGNPEARRGRQLAAQQVETAANGSD
jgi:serine/threonine protein kinase